MTRPSVTNLLASAFVALVVSTAVGGASPTPSIHGVGGGITSAKPLAAPSGPSVADQLAALRKRVDYLQNREAQDRSRIADVINVVNANADELGRWEDCTVDPIYLTFDDAGAVVSSSGMGDPQEFIVTTFDEGCLEDAS